MSDAGKLTIEVALDAQNALNQFTADLLNGLQPKLADVRKSIDDALGGGSGGKRFGDLGDIAAGSFIGSFGSQLATKGLAIIQDFASKAVSVVESVLSKGWDRLVTIDTAKTKMQALKLSAADTQNAMDNALAAVKGTAFGMGDAATVAASAMASGVKPGEALVKYLKLVADSAAVARKQGQGMGEAFAQMGDLINRVTRKGYASMEEIGPLMSAELPIIESLSKRLNMTGAEVMDMASKTGIGASVIRAALEDTVGGAALKMGESFEGAMENAKTAVARLGEALLKPFFQPAKDGVTDFTSAINGLTETVTRNMPEIIQVVGDVAIAFVDMTAFALRSVGDLIDGIGQIIAPLGNIQGAMLKFQAWQAEIRGDDELAEQLRKDAEEAFGLGEGLQELGQRLKGVDADPLTNKIRKLTDD
ncbi:MAG: hypothetical protein KDJ70_20285, partial [Candidatus Competibacteraceae bacterium]|nr:hypothetical protein [Candidatus Competibacteraceae bacterium]